MTPDKDMNKNLKDSGTDFVKDSSHFSPSLITNGQGLQRFFAKTDKLITALYMVTDIMEKGEPIRHRLRILGTQIISDIRSGTTQIGNRITEVVSLLNIASAMNFISEMNCGILKKEFLELNTSLDAKEEPRPTWLAQFINSPDSLDDEENYYKGHGISKGHARIGVQKGSTLMKALSDKTHLLSGNNFHGGTANKAGNRQNFDILKNKRRSDIIAIIRKSGDGATIKDIRSKMNTGLSDMHAYSEKTLQRELLSMTKEGVLSRTGEKRWSRYFVKAS